MTGIKGRLGITSSITVAFQGTAGSFSSMAARALYGSDFKSHGTLRFRDIFELVKNGQADIGVIPIENAVAGSVHENYDLLSQYECVIVAETYIPVQLHLLGINSDLAITKVFSHPKALEQCSNFIEDNPQIETVAWSDTAGAAEHVAALNKPGIAALASEEAALLNNLKIIARSVQNHPNNSTRFIAISKKQPEAKNPNRCSLIVSLSHNPGSLSAILKEIANLNLNLTKIESRPILGSPFSYLFYIDIEGSEAQSAALITLPELIKSNTESLRILGFYRSYPKNGS